MVKKQVICDNTVVEAECNLVELEAKIKEALKDATQVKQIFETTIYKGMSMHNSNTYGIGVASVGYFYGCLVFSVNGDDLSIALNEDCNVVIQIPQSDMKCRVFFKDYKMWLILK